MAHGGRGGRRSQRTRDTLLRAGESEFSERGFHSSSVSSICRRAGVANGTFYRHFESKTEIFAALVERLEKGMCERVAACAASEPQHDLVLIRAYRALLAYVREETALYLVGRSAESMQMGIHRHFRAHLADVLEGIVRQGVEAGCLRPVDPEIAAYLILGVIEFAIMRYVVWAPGGLSEAILQTFDAFLLHGIDAGTPWAAAPDVSRPSIGSEPEGAEATRQALLSAAEHLFGQAGFHDTAISGITYLAGVAQGTFYLHFPSKVAVFADLVREINRRFRREERRALAGLSDRRQIESEGFRTFFRFIGAHRGAYRLLREAEFVEPETARWYYERLAEGYIRGLRKGIERGEIRPLAVEPLAYALLGAGHSIALWTLNETDETAERLVSEQRLEGLLDLLWNGMAPNGSTAGGLALRRLPAHRV